MILLPLAGAVLAGALLACQAPFNAALARSFAGPVLAAAISFGVGFTALTGFVTVRGAWPADSLGIAQTPWWTWLGGLLGAGYMVLVVWSTPQLGVLSTAGALALGQVVAALAIDATGAFGLPVQDISWQRLGAGGLILVGVLLSRGG